MGFSSATLKSKNYGNPVDFVKSQPPKKTPDLKIIQKTNWNVDLHLTSINAESHLSAE